MKRSNILLTILLAIFFVAFTSFAQEESNSKEDSTPLLQIHGQTVGAIQALTLDNDSHTQPKMPWGFQSARGNLDFNVHIADGVDVFFDAYLSSNHHEGQWYDDQGYITITHLPKEADILGLNNNLFKYVTLKAGFIPVGFGLWSEIRSDNADVQRNPLVGNYIVDANDVEPSLEIRTKPGMLNALIAFGDGTTTGDFTPGRGNEVNARVWLDMYKVLDLAVSAYRSNQSNNGTGYPGGGSTTDLFAGNRSGAQYTGAPGGIFPNGYENGDIAPQKGQNVWAYQFDGFYDMKPIKIFGMVGFTQDIDINGSAPGSPDEAWSYYGADITYYLFPALYVAGRYSAATSGIYQGVRYSSNPTANRIQLGAGLWLTKQMLFKLEYVNQHYKNFPVGSLYADNARFHGLTLQFSVSF